MALYSYGPQVIASYLDPVRDEKSKMSSSHESENEDLKRELYQLRIDLIELLQCLITDVGSQGYKEFCMSFRYKNLVDIVSGASSGN